MGIMKHLVGIAAAVILVLAVTGVSSMAIAQGGPPRGGPPRGGPPQGGPPMGGAGDMMTTMSPRGKRSAHHDPTHMTTTMGPREKRSPQDGSDCPPPPNGPPPHGPPPNGPPPHGPPPCGPPSDTSNSSGGNETEGAADTTRQKRSPQNSNDQNDFNTGSDSMSPSMPSFQIPNGNMGKVSNMIISTT
ncbi:uncharacterized protein LOC143215436 [Lasioglossum baleicum]|uniref:uncharacterized protein LOC143215436 n=1 Tax=Lasioglossum baleicum TaxID=434251 RepID=UPI003FCE9E14